LVVVVAKSGRDVADLAKELRNCNFCRISIFQDGKKGSDRIDSTLPSADESSGVGNAHFVKSWRLRRVTVSNGGKKTDNWSQSYDF
jgi:hypothetical protein